MAKDERIDTRVSAELKAKLQRFAVEDRRHLASFVELVLEDYAAGRERKEKRK